MLRFRSARQPGYARRRKGFISRSGIVAQHFQINVESLAREVFRLIGFEGEPHAHLVGLATPGSDVKYPVCHRCVGQIWFRTTRFTPNAAINASYFLPTDEERCSNRL
ncbi:hypothetical protein [Sphingobium arseniciresistens]|uniref:hypothetical protein n=1 Tax=Sphingobium arseniciresistens TaxID=3030834 RepID=UPI003BAF83CB